MLIVWNERAGRGRHRRSLCPWRACVSLGWGVCLPTLPHRDQPENLSSLRHAFLRKINLNSCIQHHFIQVWWRLGPHPLGGEMPVLRRVGHPFPGPGPHPHPLPSLSYPPNRLPRRGHRAFPPEGKESSSAVTPEGAALSGPPAPVLGALGGGHPPSSPRGDGAPSPPCSGRQHACVKPHKSQIRGETGIFSLTLNNSPRAGDGLRDPVNRSCPRLSPGSHFLARGRSCCCS